MRKNSSSVSGFSIIETIISAAILAVVMVAAVGGWLYVFRGERMNSVQNELDMEVRAAMERLRADLRLSSIDKIYYYPAGPGPYTAISMPSPATTTAMACSNWTTTERSLDKTVIYHVWSGVPNQLRRTTFDPRNTNRTPAEMQAQLDSVVTVAMVRQPTILRREDDAGFPEPVYVGNSWKGRPVRRVPTGDQPRRQHGVGFCPSYAWKSQLHV